MATASQNTITVTGAWKDIAAEVVALSGVDVLIQNLDDDAIDVVAGGATAPSGKGPIRLDTLDSVQVNAANIWVRGTVLTTAVRGAGLISATVL